MIDDELREQLAAFCPTRADKLRAVGYLLRALLKDQPSNVEWALTDPDGKVYAYVTLAEEWQRRRISQDRTTELRRRANCP
jgi:hypothetical protein